MKKSTKTLIISILAAVCVVGLSLMAVFLFSGKKDKSKDSIFYNAESTITLSADYKLSDADVKATNGTSAVTIGKPIVFNLNGHNLDLNNYTLKIAFDGEGDVEFQDGNVTGNGTLDIGVPNGDIYFKRVTIADTVHSDLEAASDTIRLSNSQLKGTSVVKSKTHVQVEYSTVKNITLDGNGAKLEAKSGAKLGTLNVSPTATGASVTVDRLAEVNSVEIKAPITANVQGKVSALTVAEAVNGTSENFEIKIAKSAEINKVNLKSAASVDVQGTVSNINIASTVMADNEDFKITIKENAKVSDVSIAAANTKVEIQSKVANVVVEESATNTAVSFVGEKASVLNSVKIKAESVKVESEHNEIDVVVLESIQTVLVDDKVTTTVVDDTKMAARILEDHTHVWTTVSEVEATCEVEGSKTEKCEICNEENITAIPALGHDWHLVSRTEPTDTADGEANYKCLRCGKTKAEKISKDQKFELKGIDTIAEILGDGSYSIELDNSLVYTVGGTNVTLNIEDATLLLNCKDGKVSGFFDCDVEYSGISSNRYYEEDDEDAQNDAENPNKADDSTTVKQISVKGKLENEIITVYAVEEGEEHFVYLPVEVLVKESMSSITMLNAYSDANSAMEQAFNKIVELLHGKFNVENSRFNVSALNIIKLFFEDTKDGENTKYTFNFDKIGATGEMTVEQLIDKVFDNKSETTLYKQFRDLVTASIDKTAINALLDFASFAVENNLTEDDIKNVIQVLQDMFAEATGSDIDLVAMFTEYKDKKVGDIIIELAKSNGRKEERANDSVSAGNVGNVSEINSNSNFDAEISDGAEDEITIDDVKAELENTLKNYDELVKTTLADCVKNFGIDDASLEAIGEQLKNVGLSFTLDSANKIVSYDVSYNFVEITDEETEDSDYIKVRVTQVIGNAPQFDLDVDFQGLKAKIDKLEKGNKLTVNYQGAEFVLSAVETDNGYSFVLDGKEAVEEDAEPSNDGLKVTLNIEKTENGFVVTDAMTMKRGDEINVTQSATITFTKAEAKSSLINVGTINMEGLKEFKMVDGNTTLEMKYVSDDNGGHYELTETNQNISKREINFTAAEREDGKTVYRGWYNFNENKAIIDVANDGMPAVLISIDADCKDAYHIYLNATDVIHTQKRYNDVDYVENEDGTFTVIEIFDTEMDRSETYNYGNKSFSFYYNLKTGKMQRNSFHDISKTYKLLKNSKTCSDGVKVTETCKNCNYKSVYNNYWCPYEEKEDIEFSTQCNPKEYITLYECPVCHDQKIESSIGKYGGSHPYRYDDTTIVTHSEYEARYNELVAQYRNWNYSEEEIAERVAEDMHDYTDLNELSEKVLDTNRFYFGETMIRYCEQCGIKWVEYTWYTTDENKTYDGCRKHTAISVEYEGNEGFESFNKMVSAAARGHYTTTTYFYNDHISSALKTEAFNVIPEELRFAYTKVALRETKCKGCGIPSSKEFVFANENSEKISDKVAYVYFRYNDNGEIEYTDYCVTLYDAQKAKAEAALHGVDVSDYNPEYGYVSYGSNRDSYFSSWWYGESDFYIRTPNQPYESNHIEVFVSAEGKDGMSSYFSATYYDYDNCKQIRSYDYGYGEGLRTSEEEWHPTHTTVYGKPNGSCRNGYSVKSTCAICGKVYNESTEYSHRDHSWEHWYYDYEVSEYAQYLTNDVTMLNGLNAKISDGWYCTVCKSSIDCRIRLYSDWTLTKDVLIKAEGLYIDLNGHKIDLNGHTLKVYSDFGEDLTLTDSSYDTKAKEPISITDSVGTGLLVVFNNSQAIESALREEYMQWLYENFDYEYLEYNPVPSFEQWCDWYSHYESVGDIDLGCIGIDCNIVVSDADTLETIDAYIAECKESGKLDIYDFISQDDEFDENDMPAENSGNDNGFDESSKDVDDQGNTTNADIDESILGSYELSYLQFGEQVRTAAEMGGSTPTYIIESDGVFIWSYEDDVIEGTWVQVGENQYDITAEYNEEEQTITATIEDGTLTYTESGVLYVFEK